MHAPSAERLLQSWEEGRGAHPIERALALLHAGAPETPVDAWAGLAIGQRDAALLDLRESLFGSRIETLAHCPRCGELLESSFELRDLRVPAGPAPAGLHALSCKVNDYAIAYRLPTSADLLQALTGTSADDDAETRLLALCIAEAQHAGRALAARDLPADVVAALQADMACHDPGAETRVSLSCPACMHGFETDFDIVAYLWSELDDWAQRTLAQVHTLAAAYGWSERAILRLSPARRQHYIELVQA